MTQEAQIQYPDRISVMLQSVGSPGNFLRMAGVDNPQFNPDGFGTVNCQANCHDEDRNAWEIFDLIRSKNGTFSFESNAFPGNFLRMAGEANPQPGAFGFGTVNCQASIGSWEQFALKFTGENTAGKIVTVESAQFPGNYLRLVGEQNPVFNPAGFGTVDCQAMQSAAGMFHLQGLLKIAAGTFADWFGIEPTQQALDELIEIMVTREPTEGSEYLRTLFGEDWHRHTPEELAEIESIDLDQLSPCTQAIIVCCVDALLLALQIMGIVIVKTQAMVQATAKAIGENANGFMTILRAIRAEEDLTLKGAMIFSFVQQIFTGSPIRGILKALVAGFSWLGAVIAILSFIAQVVAWIASAGVAFVAQLVGVTLALAGFVSDVDKAITACGNSAEVVPA